MSIMVYLLTQMHSMSHPSITHHMDVKLCISVCASWLIFSFQICSSHKKIHLNCNKNY